MKNQISRRRFLQTSAAVTGVFQLGWTASGAWAVTDQATRRVNPFIKISADNRVTLVVGQAEMGQGISTGLAMVLADELGADWSRVGWEQAPNDLAFALPGGFQSTGGSG